jgi:hypothetical protein
MTIHLSGDMYGKYFPGEPYVTEFVPTAEEAAATTAVATRRGCEDLLPMLLGTEVAS